MGVTSLAGGPRVTPFIAQSHALWAPINLLLVLSLSNSINEYVYPTWQDEFTTTTCFYYLKYKKVHIIRSLTPILTPISEYDHKNAFCISNLVGKEVLHVILVWLLKKVTLLKYVAAILAVMLDFSDCPRLLAWYPPDIYHRAPKDVISIKKKLYPSVQGYAYKPGFGCLTISNFIPHFSGHVFTYPYWD